MNDAAVIQGEFRRYAELIGRMVKDAGALVAEAEDSSSVQVERAVVFPSLLTGAWSIEKSALVERLIEISIMPHLPEIAVVDRRGHHRPVYRPLLVYAWLQAYRLAYEVMPREIFGRWEEGLRPWCDLLESRLGEVDWPRDATAAEWGATAVEAVWMALALYVAGKVFVRDAWTDLAGDVFGKLTRGQRASGAFLAATPGDNPETHWYHELVLLHAAGSYAVQAEDRAVSVAVAKNAAFHLNETQPDHATAQPWGVFGFVWSPGTRSLADQVLHGATTQNPGGFGGVDLVLLGDALYCLRLFL